MKKKIIYAFVLISLFVVSLPLHSVKAELTKTEKSFVIEKKIATPMAYSDNDMFWFQITIDSPGTTVDGNKDRYNSKYAFRLKNGSYRTLTSFKSYINRMKFHYTNWGGPNLGEGEYEWNQELQSWVIQNPFVDNAGESHDTTYAHDGSDRLKMIFEEKAPNTIEYHSMSDLSWGTNTASETRPTILFDGLDSAKSGDYLETNLHIYQEKLAFSYGHGGIWYNYNLYNTAVFSYIYDASISATDPQSAHNLILGDTVSFDSTVDVTTPESFNTVSTWQVSNDGGLTYEDIEGTESTTKDAQFDRNYTFAPTYEDEGNLYRLKVVPKEVKDGVEPLYTQPATLSFRKHTVSFDSNGGSTVPNQTVYYGQHANDVTPLLPGYEFEGWYTESELTSKFDFATAIIDDITLFAKWSEIAKLTVQFVDHDGTLLKQEIVLSGDAATAPSDPSRDGYTFTGWDKDFSNITENLTVTATYTKDPEPEVLTVQFIDHDGTLLKEELVSFGDAATAPSDPSRDGYTFTGWDKDFSNITENLTVTAVYTKDPEPEVLTVQFIDHDGTLLKEELVLFGNAATAPSDPSRDGYTFSGWDKDFSNITENLTVTATYTKDPEPEVLTVQFIDHDGTLLKEELVLFGNAATAPSDPTRDGYIFAGWDKDFSNITENLTVTALYEEAETGIQRITVQFVDHDGTLLKQELVFYGDAATAPSDPSRDGYTFIGWDKDFSNVTDTLIVTALYEKNEEIKPIDPPVEKPEDKEPPIESPTLPSTGHANTTFIFGASLVLLGIFIFLVDTKRNVKRK